MLDPWFVTGFTDGEGCFALYVRADRQKRKNHVAVYYRWQADFAFQLRGDDLDLLEGIKNFFGCGIISMSKSKVHSLGLCNFHCIVPADLVNRIIPHFESYPLRSKKKNDFKLWKEAVKIIKVAKDRRIKDKSRSVVYTNVENERLLQIVKTLKNRVTGGHLTQWGIDYTLQGTKETVPREFP